MHREADADAGSTREGPTPKLHQWLKLPGLGGNSIMLGPAAVAGGNDLVMYPRCHGYELFFFLRGAAK